MRIALIVHRTLLVLLGVSTGAVKLAHMPEEMAIFRGAGMADPLTVAFGVAQIAAALAIVHPRSRRAGSVVLGLSFALATGVLLANGLVAFGVFSLLFIAMAAVAATVDSAPERGDVGASVEA